MKLETDVVIVGSGFGGTITALLLDRIGLRAVLLERGTHPRFALGESSTPIADGVLRSLARKYHLPRLEPLTAYGSWQATYPQLVCGLKRGFSYFLNQPKQSFRSNAEHDNELLVAASSQDALADTHWLRSDVDNFLVQEAQNAGIEFFDQCEIVCRPRHGGWQINGRRLDQDLEVQARFVVDASGDGGALCKALGIRSSTQGLTTHSRTIYGHFRNLGSWHDQLIASGGCVSDHPFRCDDAALHQLIDEGWMWQLRFNNGVTSAGFMIDDREHPYDPARSATEEWNALLSRYPSIARQFAKAKFVDPPGGLRRTPRLQRWAEQMAGDTWAMLPSTAGIIDALHSTGIAHNLCGIERLVTLLAEHWGRSSLSEAMRGYHESTRREIALVDKLVSGCYATRHDFQLFSAFVMLYFLAATNYEHCRYELGQQFRGEFLSADDDTFRQLCETIWSDAQRLIRGGPVSKQAAEQFVNDVAHATRPYNRVGLFDPAAKNMYRHTAAPK